VPSSAEQKEHGQPGISENPKHSNGSSGQCSGDIGFDGGRDQSVQPGTAGNGAATGAGAGLAPGSSGETHIVKACRKSWESTVSRP
jgi:hypothetical protein